MSFTSALLSQRDPRWKGEALGFDNTITVGTDGCALTCLAMLVNGYGFSETPSTLNKKLKDMGSGNGFLGGLIVWGGLTRAFPGIVFRNIVICRDQPAPIDSINTSLDLGQPLLVELDRSPSPGLQTHWVVLTSRQGDDYLMLDPFPQPSDAAPASLAARYGFSRPLNQVITAVVWYEAVGLGPVNAPPSGGIVVRVQTSMTAGLRLRSAPATTAATVAIEPAGTALHCLEPDEAVLAKIGVTDQWLKVVDPGDNNGYVAAWYVDKVGGSSPAPIPVPAPTPAPSPAPAPTPGPSGLTVLVSQTVGGAGLRVRLAADTNAASVVIVQAGAELAVIEPEGQARPKIGQENQWLNVREGGGKTGFAAAWYLELKPGASSPAAAPTSASPASALTVTVSNLATAGLRLRDQPNAGANTLKVLFPGTALAVLDTPASAQTRIGVNGQWLNVKEPGGQAGFVAAWYVQN